MGKSTKKGEKGQAFVGTPSEWILASEAAKILASNSGRPVGRGYPSQLKEMGKVRTYTLNSRVTLYNRQDIEAYVVEARGQKGARAKKAQALVRREEPRADGES